MVARNFLRTIANSIKLVLVVLLGLFFIQPAHGAIPEDWIINIWEDSLLVLDNKMIFDAWSDRIGSKYENLDSKASPLLIAKGPGRILRRPVPGGNPPQVITPQDLEALSMPGSSGSSPSRKAAKFKYVPPKRSKDNKLPPIELFLEGAVPNLNNSPPSPWEGLQK